jgi:hypothetical protein
LAAVPDIGELISSLEQVHDIATLSAIGMAVSARIASLAQHSNSAGDDELCDVSEAARITGLSESALYHGKWPFIVRLGRRRMFSRSGIQKFIAKNAGR